MEKACKLYAYLKEQYPEVITLEQLYRICHISKRKGKWMLENRVIPCQDSEKKTRRFKIKLDDVIAYLEKEAAEGRTVIPAGIFSEKQGAEKQSKCRKLICDIQRNYHLPWKAKTIGEMLAVARQKSGAAKLEGHDIMALERFDPDVRHMIEFEVLSADSTMGYAGDHMRLFLTEEGYGKALENQEKQSIAIGLHANVLCGHLEYDNKNLPVSRSAGLEP